MNNEELWQTVLAQIQFSIPRATFATWFKNTKISNKDKGRVVVAVENSFSKEWLNNKYSSLILKILRDVDEDIKGIEFFVESEKEPQKKTAKKERVPVNQLPFQELVIDQKTNLNPRYTFESLVIGRFNEMAHAAAWAISENPGAVYNPLFLYGGVGLGKTHLLEATGNRIAELSPEKRVKYIPCERFVSQIVEAIKNREVEAFKQRMKDIDVVIMDDVQFFTGKEKSQEEFFHIFNLLHQSQKQIILSSDRSPKAIPGLTERLRSRFEGGMLVDIGTPDLETKIAILKSKCEEQGINMSQEIIEYIATNVKNNVRELEGALNKVSLFNKMSNKALSVDSVKKQLKSIIDTPKKATNFKQIVQAIANFYDLREKDLLLTTRKKEIVKPRQIAMYLLREELNESYPSIGRRFGGKDHTTAIYAYLKINKEMENNDTLMSEVNLIKQRIYSGTIGKK